MTLRPKKLSATVQAVPYRLDNLAGAVSLDDGKVTLSDLSATHKEIADAGGPPSGSNVRRTCCTFRGLAGLSLQQMTSPTMVVSSTNRA